MQGEEVPCWKFISNPSRLESQISTSYYDKSHGTYICCSDNNLCPCALQNLSVQIKDDKENTYQMRGNMFGAF
jgi:hypothetical protein